MASKIKTFLFPAAVLIAAAAHSAQPFDRYQTVIDRKPFGPEPANFDPETPPGSAAAASAAAGGEMTEEQRTAEEQQLAASVRVSMINVTPSGAVAVGFTDSSANPAENHYLVVGRSQNGWTVKSADPASETVELEKGGVAVKIKLGESTGAGGAKGAKNRRPVRPAALQQRGGDPMRDALSANGDSVSAAPGGARLGGLARLRQRRAEMRAKAEADAAKKAEADAVAAAERAERAEREAEEKRQRAEREAREAEEREQQREALRQIQEQLRKEREAREASDLQTEQSQEE